MEEADIPRVKSLADAIHTNYPEDEAIFAEKQRLYPEGCFSLISDNELVGYIISHPWRLGETPAINKFLNRLPEKPDTLYWHDIALSPKVRARGAVQEGVSLVLAHARAASFASVSGTAVSGTAIFWKRQGFSFLSETAHDLPSYGKEARLMVLFLPKK